MVKENQIPSVQRVEPKKAKVVVEVDTRTPLENLRKRIPKGMRKGSIAKMKRKIEQGGLGDKEKQELSEKIKRLEDSLNS